MKHHLLALALTASLGLGALGAQAQTDPCPPNLACVEYAGVVLEIDPVDGPIQLLIVQEDTTRSRHINGEDDKAVTLYGAIFIQTGPKAYEFERLYGPFEPTGIFKDAQLRDTFGLENLGQ